MLNAEQIYKVLHERNSVQRRLARATFELWQRLGFHVVGDHFYDPVPNTHTIRDTYVNGPRELPAITVNWPSLVLDACALLDTNIDDYLQHRTTFGYVEHNFYFAGIDALYYYSFIRTRQPKRIVEIGQGFSTRIALSALTQNASVTKTPPELISIDPYSRLAPQITAAIRYSTIKHSLQETGRDITGMLSEGDLLFVDSSHVFKFGSDVKFLFEFVYPCLDVGVILHIHDIFTPFDYPVDWMTKEKRFWNEQYFLESFLSYNKNFRIEAAVHSLARDGAVDRLLSNRNLGPDVVRREGTSLYLRRTDSA
jgi:methyltransferase family protein